VCQAVPPGPAHHFPLQEVVGLEITLLLARGTVHVPILIARGEDVHAGQRRSFVLSKEQMSLARIVHRPHHAAEVIARPSEDVVFFPL
jgi:hypothetical protein